jgi:hypothetical protein
LERFFASAAPKSGIQQKPVQILITLCVPKITELVLATALTLALCCTNMYGLKISGIKVPIELAAKIL